MNEMPYVPTAKDIADTAAAEAQLNRDPIARIRPIITAVWDTVREMAPQIPNAFIGQMLTENEVFKFLECLERHGYTVVPVDKG